MQSDDTALPALGRATRKSTSVMSSELLSVRISERHHSRNWLAVVGDLTAAGARSMG